MASLLCLHCYHRKSIRQKQDRVGQAVGGLDILENYESNQISHLKMEALQHERMSFAGLQLFPTNTCAKARVQNQIIKKEI